ncbi:MAG: methyltransferase domain-containing protein [Alphaproteobacteria bacterium]|nr:methyltransferase domain-containing protein [Alphaproteobacteria bacterium]
MADIGFTAVMRAAIEPMLDETGAAPGIRVLDVACGAAAPAADAAVSRGATVAGIDLSPSSIAAARRACPDIRFEVGSAESLPFGDNSFDAVIINLGVLHFASPEAALGEAHRVLASGGRIGFTVWAAPERALGYGVPIEALERHGIADSAPSPRRRYFRFGDHDECRRVLAEAGFSEPSIRDVDRVWRAPSAAEVFEYLVQGIIVGTALRAQPAPAGAAIRAAAVSGFEAFADGDGDGVAIPMTLTLATAVKQ